MSNLAMNNQTLIAAAIILVMLITPMAVAWFYARRAYDQGLCAGRLEGDKAIYDLSQALTKQQLAAKVSRNHTAEAFEQQWLSHETELAAANSKTDALARDKQQLQAENTELQKQAQRQSRVISLLQTAPPYPEYISARDVERVTAMAEKLRIAAPALHATQQFKAAKEAERLAHAGQIMADKFSSALKAAHNANAQPQDAAA